MPRHAQSNLSASLDMAGLLTQHLIRLGGIGPEDVLQIISRLVGEVELAFAIDCKPAGPRPPAAPLPRAEPAAGAGLRLLGQRGDSPGSSLGELLVYLGHARPEQVEEAARTQRATGARIGETLVQMGVVTWEQVSRAVQIQQQLNGALGS